MVLRIGMVRTTGHKLQTRLAAPLGSVSKVFAGIGVSREDSVQQPGERSRVIGVRDLQDGGVAWIGELDQVGFPDPGRAASYAVQPDDVLLTGRGTLLKFGLVGSETNGAIASGNIIVVRPGAAAVGGALYALLSSDVFRPQIEVLRRGATTLLSLSPKDLAKLEISLPPLDEQHRIAALVRDARDAYRTAIEAADIRRRLARRLIDARLFGDNERYREGPWQN